MEVKIESTTENKLLDRKEIEVFVYFAGATPNRKEIKTTICGKIGADPDLVVLRTVKNEFGLRRLQVSCHAYPNAEALRKNEPRFLLKREGMMSEEEIKKEAEKKAKAKAGKKSTEKKK